MSFVFSIHSISSQFRKYVRKVIVAHFPDNIIPELFIESESFNKKTLVCINNEIIESSSS